MNTFFKTFFIATLAAISVYFTAMIVLAFTAFFWLAGEIEVEVHKQNAPQVEKCLDCNDVSV